MKNQTLFSITPISGLGEIGSNFTLIQTKNNKILVDAGIKFPKLYPGACNASIPDPQEIRDLKIDILWITHGHEDHIGAIQYIWQKKTPRLIASKFASHLIKGKTTIKSIEVYNDGYQLSLDDVTLSPIRVNHSIPDTFGLEITTKDMDHYVFFSSDFKINKKNYLEDIFDTTLLKKRSSSYKNVSFFCDSTNILKEKESVEEYDLREILIKTIQNKSGNIFATFFPSNIFRLNSFLIAAESLSISVFLLGKSMVDYYKTANSNGYLQKHSPPKYAEDFKDSSHQDQILFLVSGCQGDFYSALSSVVRDGYKGIHLNENDHLLYSAKIIPGNEINVTQLFNLAAQKKVNIITDKGLHSSGHATQENIEQVLLDLEPDHLFPIHGEEYFFQFFKNFAQKFKTQCITIENNTSIDFLINGKIATSQISPFEDVYLLSRQCLVEKSTLNEKTKILRNGVVFISIIKGKQTQLRFSTKGLPAIDFSRIHKKLLVSNPNEDSIKSIIRKAYKDAYGIRPEIVLHLIQ